MPHSRGAFLFVFKELDQSRQEFLVQLPRPAFPDNQHVPSVTIQLLADTTISLHIPSSFCFPKLSIGLWCYSTKPARMPMPETPMYEDNLVSRRKDKVWFPRQLSHMQTKSIAKPMNNRSDQNFRFRVARPDLRHIERSLCLRMDVGHRSRSSAKLASSMMMR